MAQKKVLILDTDKIQINPAQEESVILLRRIVKLLESSGTIDVKQRQKITIDALGNSGGTPTEVAATVPVSGSVTATLAASAINAGNIVVQYGPQATAAAAGLDSRFLLMDTSRNAYANGIRANLAYSITKIYVNNNITAADGVSTLLIAANNNRTALIITNNGAKPVYLGIGGAAADTKGIYLATGGGSFEINSTNWTPAAVYAIGIGGTSVVSYTEY